jgi:iron complex outermembrane recepter protein
MLGCSTASAVLMALAAPVAAQSQAVTYNFNIPSQPLASALRAYGQASNQAVAFDADVVAGKRAPALVGAYTADEGLRALIAGSGLVVRRTPNGVAYVEPARPPVQAPQGDADEPTAVTELIVTAGRREQQLTDVPMSLTAMSAESIERRGIVSREDFLRSIPGVNATDQGPGQNAIIIRGAYGDPFGTGPTVGVYMGDIPLAGLALGASTDIKLIDIERVEVLRGPQGTLYGSNSLSGTIRYIPKAPDLRDASGELSVGYSHTGGYGGGNSQVEGVLNVPIVPDRVAIRVSAFRHDNGGYIKNVAGDDPVLQQAATFFGAQNLAGGRDIIGDSQFTGLRAGLLWQATDRFSLNLNYFKQVTSQDDRPFAQRGYGRFQRSTYDMRPTLGDVDAMRIELDVISFTATLDLEQGEIVSTTSLVKQDFRRNWEIGSLFRVNGLAPPMPQTSRTKTDLFTQEVRFASQFDGPLQVIAGLFYEESDQPTVQAAYYAGAPARNPIAAGVSGEVYANYVDRQVEQKAVFGEVSYALPGRITLTAGGRYFKYDAVFQNDRPRSANPVTRPLTFETVRTEESGTILKAGAKYEPTERSMIYASYSEGFRLGRPIARELIRSACDRDNDGILDGTDVRSDTSLIGSDRLSTYEVGAKTAMFDNRVSLSASAYRNDWTDIPIVFRPPNCTVNTTVNGGKARATGFEIEGTVRPTSGLRLEFGLGYVKSELAKTSSLGADGELLNYAPKLNAVVSAEYNYQLLGRDAWIRTDYNYFDKFYTGIGRRGTKFGAYAVLGLSAGLELGNVEVRAFVQNLTDVYAVTSESTFPTNGIYLVKPRTVGLRMDLTF